MGNYFKMQITSDLDQFILGGLSISFGQFNVK